MRMKAPSLLRAAIQLLCFLLIPGLFVDALHGLRAFIQALASGTSDWYMTMAELFPTALLLLATFLLGRVFCGFMCAFGTLGDACHWVGQKLFHIRFHLSARTDKQLKRVKFILLLALIVVWVAGINFLDSWSPWTAFGVLKALPPDFSYAIHSVTVGSMLLVLILLGSCFVERLFCRYFCPMGALFHVTSKGKRIEIRKPRENCGACRSCTAKCAMGIALNKTDRVTSGDCIGCMKCVTVCPKNNAQAQMFSKPSPQWTAPFAALLVLALYLGGNVGVTALLAHRAQNAQEIPSAETRQIDEPSASSSYAEASNVYADGTYEGSGTGFHNRTTTVSVKITEGEIEAIETVSTGDDTPYYNRAFATIVSRILSEQQPQVDAVSGATFSSRGIMDAVADALQKAAAE